jgi:hypothetical protein
VFQAADTDDAMWRFVGWVVESDRRNREAAEQAARWLRARGLRPPGR